MKQRLIEAQRITEEILNAPKFYFKDLKPSML